MAVKQTVLPGYQPPTVAFTVLAQLCGLKVNETEMGAALFTNNGEGRNFEFDFLTYYRGGCHIGNDTSVFKSPFQGIIDQSRGHPAQ